MVGLQNTHYLYRTNVPPMHAFHSMPYLSHFTPIPAMKWWLIALSCCASIAFLQHADAIKEPDLRIAGSSNGDALCKMAISTLFAIVKRTLEAKGINIDNKLVDAAIQAVCKQLTANQRAGFAAEADDQDLTGVPALPYPVLDQDDNFDQFHAQTGPGFERFNARADFLDDLTGFLGNALCKPTLKLVAEGVKEALQTMGVEVSEKQINDVVQAIPCKLLTDIPKMIEGLVDQFGNGNVGTPRLELDVAEELCNIVVAGLAPSLKSTLKATGIKDEAIDAALQDVPCKELTHMPRYIKDLIYKFEKTITDPAKCYGNGNDERLREFWELNQRTRSDETNPIHHCRSTITGVADATKLFMEAIGEEIDKGRMYVIINCIPCPTLVKSGEAVIKLLSFLTKLFKNRQYKALTSARMLQRKGQQNHKIIDARLRGSNERDCAEIKQATAGIMTRLKDSDQITLSLDCPQLLVLNSVVNEFVKDENVVKGLTQALGNGGRKLNHPQGLQKAKRNHPKDPLHANANRPTGPSHVKGNHPAGPSEHPEPEIESKPAHSEDGEEHLAVEVAKGQHDVSAPLLSREVQKEVKESKAKLDGSKVKAKLEEAKAKAKIEDAKAKAKVDGSKSKAKVDGSKTVVN